MNRTVLAVFDLDKTLTIGRSLESAFIQFLLRRRALSFRALLLSALFYLKHVWRDPVTATKRNKLYLRGATRDDMGLWVAEFMREQGEGLVSGEGARLVRHHKGLGHLTVLVTGSPEMLVLPLLRLLDIPFDRVYSTDLEAVDGVFTGHIRGAHYYGREKATLVERLAGELDADLRASYCYADSQSDIPMMAAFGNPVAVNPDKRLRQASLDRCWKIIELTGNPSSGQPEARAPAR